MITQIKRSDNWDEMRETAIRSGCSWRSARSRSVIMKSPPDQESRRCSLTWSVWTKVVKAGTRVTRRSSEDSTRRLMCAKHQDIHSFKKAWWTRSSLPYKSLETRIFTFSLKKSNEPWRRRNKIWQGLRRVKSGLSICISRKSQRSDLVVC